MSGARLYRVGAGSTADGGGSTAPTVATLDGAAVVEVVHDPEPGVVEVSEPVLVGADTLGVALDDLVDVVVPEQVPSGIPLVLARDAGGTFVLREQSSAVVGAHQHVQSVPSTIWLILHPLPFTPAGLAVTSPDGSRRLWPQRVTYPAPGRVRLDFTRPVPGIAHLS